jgi:hypothetical protein
LSSGQSTNGPARNRSSVATMIAIRSASTPRSDAYFAASAAGAKERVARLGAHP